MEDPLSSPGPVQALFLGLNIYEKMSSTLEILLWVFVFNFLNSKVKIEALSIDSYFIDRSYMCLVIVNYFKAHTEEAI